MSMATTMNAPAPALRHGADSHDMIRVHGARVNNLKDVSVELPKRRLTVFTGVSGSGKSSLVFHTIAAESQRMINETYSAFVQGFMPTLARPDVDVLDGLTTAIIVDQQRMGADPRSTVGTATDTGAMLRILFSRLGQPHIGSAQAFSFNVASISGAGAVTIERGRADREGAAQLQHHRRHVPALRGPGLGQRHRPDPLYDDSKSLNEGALTIPGYSMERLVRCGSTPGAGFFDPDKPIRKYTKRELHDLLYKEPTKIKVEGINLTYEGLIPQDPEVVSCPRTSTRCSRTSAPSSSGRSRSPPAPSATAPGCPRRPARRRSRGSASPTPAPCRSATSPPGSREPRRAVGGAAAHDAAPHPRLVRGDRAGLPVARAAVGHAVGRRGAAHQDDPPPRLLAHRRHLRLRRADHRPAPARHPADERAAAAAARQGQHGARRRAQAGGDRHRRPRRRPRPRRRHGGRHHLLRGHLRGAAGQRHPHRPPSGRPGRPQGDGAQRPPARCRSAARRRTTCATSTSTSRSGCWSSSPASPAPARAR